MVGPEIQNRGLENYEWEFEVHCVPHFSAEIVDFRGQLRITSLWLL